jgi:hypothetical protein
MLIPYAPLPRFQGIVAFCGWSLFAGGRFLRVVAFCGWSLFAKEYNHPCKGDQLGKVLIFEVAPMVHTYPAGSGCSVKKAVSFYAGFHARDAKVLSGASPGVNNDRSIDSILAMGQGWFRL